MKVSFIGGGVMAEAIISGVIQAKLDVDITVSEPIPDRAAYLQETYGVVIAKNNRDATVISDLVVLSVKPQQLSYVADEIRGIVLKLPDVTFMSIMAGVLNQDDRRSDRMRSCNQNHGQHSGASGRGRHRMDRLADCLG